MLDHNFMPFFSPDILYWLIIRLKLSGIANRSNPRWRDTEAFFKGIGKMRQRFEAQLQVNVGGLFTHFIEQEIGFLQATLNEPVIRRIIEYLLKIPFKCR